MCIFLFDFILCVFVFSCCSGCYQFSFVEFARLVSIMPCVLFRAVNVDFNLLFVLIIFACHCAQISYLENFILVWSGHPL